jgi:LacI family transcriptional regulator
MGITTKDLARICGVSRTTVHRALSDTGRINPQTKDIILKTAKDYDYRPDLLARGLVKGQTFYIGVVVLDVNNRYFSQMLSAIEGEARKRGYFINITLHEKDKEMEKEQLNRLADYHVDGIILSSINKGSEYKKFLEGLDVPIVSIDNKIAEGIPFVGIDERMATKEATIKILNKGYDKVVFVCPPLEDKEHENIYVHEERTNGFEEAMKEYPDRKKVIIGKFDFFEDCYKELDSNKRTAYFCTGDMFALDLMKFLTSKGKTAPKDFGIMGFDNIDTLQYVSPRLATIYNSVEEVARTAVNLLFDLINESDTEIERILGYIPIEGETL